MPGGGARARRTRWTFLSLLVTVPSVSAQPAWAGRTTSAISAVWVKKRSCATRKSRFRSRRRARSLSASELTGFLAEGRRGSSVSPRSIASNIWLRCHPRFDGMLQFQADSNLRRRSGFSTCWNPVSRSGSAPMSPPPCTLFWPRSGHSPEPYRPTCPRQQSEVDQRPHVIDGVMVLGDPQRPAQLSGRSLGVRMRQVADGLRGHPGFPLRVLEREGLDRVPGTPRSRSSHGR